VITEVQPELMSIAATANDVMPLIARAMVDFAHNPAYAVGCLFNELKPRMAMTTHISYDEYSNTELQAEIRNLYKGPFHFGAPDLVVVNLTRDKVWVREGVVPRFPSMSRPKFDVAALGGLIIPAPKNKRADVQQQSIRDAEILPSAYYPKGHQPDLIESWPTDKPVFIPEDQVPPGLKLKP